MKICTSTKSGMDDAMKVEQTTAQSNLRQRILHIDSAENGSINLKNALDRTFSKVNVMTFPNFLQLLIKLTFCSQFIGLLRV